ncbi:50S ribosomal protein L1 [Candidatus Phytoplasma pruni]|uniref:Large ribosomal subunit protein uL1 n=1 Tax=Candidatus Phytoplasma pruni TaxID=479893 RepID=A0A851HCR4_9MOLU|nr:50S ribosomal protein L1 [Candidatus Phytoplasma pruni]NWN45778.1 50S ribosomal protein L1 [Candidatus Phytoplasma pruni]
MKRSKKYLAMRQMIDSKKSYSVSQAVDLVQQTQLVKFDATVECIFSLNLDPKKAEQNIRGALVLPHGSGKKLKVAVLAKGMKVKEAEEAGADVVGDQELVNKIAKNWLDFDVLIATPEMMPSVSKLGRVLGPKGLMPNPKLGTVTDNLAPLIKDIKKGRIEYRVDKNGNLHTILGKTSFSKEQLLENAQFLYEHIASARPKTVKGNFIKSMTLSSTMAPGVRVDHTLMS